MYIDGVINDLLFVSFHAKNSFSICMFSPRISVIVKKCAYVLIFLYVMNSLPKRERERRTIQLFRGHLFRDHPFRGQLFRGHLFRGHLFRGHLFRGHGGVREDDRYKVCSQDMGMAECAKRLEL